MSLPILCQPLAVLTNLCLRQELCILAGFSSSASTIFSERILTFSLMRLVINLCHRSNKNVMAANCENYANFCNSFSLGTVPFAVPISVPNSSQLSCRITQLCHAPIGWIWIWCLRQQLPAYAGMLPVLVAFKLEAVKVMPSKNVCACDIFIKW